MTGYSAEDAAPTHLVAEPGDTHVMCGARDVYPRMWVRWLSAHQARRTVVVCPECDVARQGVSS